MIHPDWLRSFEAFAQAQSFTAAAKRLHLTQPAVHGHVSKLADALGVVLYERRGRAMLLTPAGEVVLGHARAQAELDATLLARLDGREDRRVVLAAGEGSFLYLLPDAIRVVLGAGDVDLRLLTVSAEGAVAALRSGRAHLAVTVLAEKPDDLDGRVLRRVAPQVVLAADHPLAAKRSLTPKHLAAESLILPPRGRPHREAVLRAFAEAGVTPELALEANGWPLLMGYAALGLGVAIVNGICRPPPGAVVRPFRGLPRVSYYLLHSPGALQREVLARVHAVLREGVAAAAPFT